MIEDHENAVKDFDAVIKKNPKNAHGHFRRAFSHKALA
jgi:tetratricopeptide (TPR) repeat protein